MGSQFVLEKVEFALDGELVYMRTCIDHSCDVLPGLIYFGQPPPGRHELSARIRHRGRMGVGVFSYIRAYTFDVRSAHRTRTERGQRTAVTVTAYERGSVVTPIAERPAVRWQESMAEL